MRDAKIIEVMSGRSMHPDKWAQYVTVRMPIADDEVDKFTAALRDMRIVQISMYATGKVAP